MDFSYTYMMTNSHNTVIYTGLTSNLIKRVYQHKTKAYKGFTSKYNCDKLVFYQEFTNINEAIALEKKIKAGSRSKKEKMIFEQNPEWKDLSDGWLFII
ncbi:GIY-YIG nuclease family protein [Salinimicrobium xinjiangense]|uniref:GIY-YIG nuclease family protein n=1 Tax=Salinimicrobium xinjiangense TaxID=438596 RepID=UPI0003FF6ECC|nr:GIY-YIG nuclease family protein [Salinimicrobium xinjiangense]